MASWQEQQRRIAQQQDEERRQQAQRDRQLRYEQEQQRAYHRHLGKEGMQTSHPANQATYRAHQDKQARARSNNTCFPGDVRVRAIDGWRRLDSLGPSDVVVSHGAEGLAGEAEVLCLRQYQAARIWEIALENGTRVRATRHHRFRTARGWTTLGRLRRGDVLVCEDGVSRIAHVEDTGRNQEVFNLIVAAPHTYLVEGCVVHSFSSFARLQAGWFALAGWLRAAAAKSCRERSGIVDSSANPA